MASSSSASASSSSASASSASASASSASASSASPSHPDGIFCAAPYELSPADCARVVDFLHEAGVKLRVSMAVVAAAAAFFLRSLASGGSPGVLVMPRCLEKYDRMLVAATCLFLATKVEEQPRRIRDVLNTTHRIAYPGRPPLVIDQEFAARREAIVTCEQSVLRALRFDTEVPSPHTHLVTVAQDLECQIS